MISVYSPKQMLVPPREIRIKICNPGGGERADGKDGSVRPMSQPRSRMRNMNVTLLGKRELKMDMDGT